MRSNPSQNIEMIALRRFKLKRSLRPMRSARLPGIVWLPWVCVVPPLSAQDLAPGTGQMIEQLKLQRTHSLRNLTVEVATVAAPHQAPSAAGHQPGTTSTSSSTLMRPRSRVWAASLVAGRRLETPWPLS